MFAEIFKGLFDSSTTRVISVEDFLLCVGVSLLLGVIIAASYTYRNKYSNSFLAALAALPAVVCVVIMMVNGNVGAGVAVAGAFGLVRFRSAPGTAREIGVVFLAMGAGLIAGMGYLAYALLFTLILSAVNMLWSYVSARLDKREALQKTLRITIPEDLNYDGVFDGILAAYAREYELTSVKTTNMGSLFRLSYDLRLKAPGTEKALLDELRRRNGNLEIVISRREAPLAPEL